MALHVAYQNVRGMRTKLYNFKENIESNHHDIVFVTESWLNDTVDDCELVDGDFYSIFRRDRGSSSSTKKDGGGVLVAVANWLKPEPLMDFNSEAEDMWLAVVINGVKVFLCCVYLPPGDDAASASFVSKLELNKFAIGDGIMLVCGDFNCPAVNWVSQNGDNSLLPSDVDDSASRIIDSLCFMELAQYNNIVNKNGRILDLVMCSNACIKHLMRNESPFVMEDGHHPALEFLLDIGVPQYLRKAKNFFRSNFKKANYDELNDRLAATNWDVVLSGDNVDVKIDRFYEIIDDVMMQGIPKIRVNNEFPVFFSMKTVIMIKKKNKIHKKWIKYQNLDDFRTFKNLRSLCKRLISSDRSKYLEKIELDLHANSKNFFRYVSNKKKQSRFPVEMIFREERGNTSEDISGLFAKFFQKVYEPENQCYPDVNNIQNLYGSNYLQGITFELEEVLAALNSVDCSKGAGPDGIPSVFLRNCASALAPPLLHIFNFSLSSSTFPKKWKISSIIPIHKKGPINNVENYRPISIMSAIPKIFESLIYKYKISIMLKV